MQGLSAPNPTTQENEGLLFSETSSHTDQVGLELNRQP